MKKILSLVLAVSALSLASCGPVDSSVNGGNGDDQIVSLKEAKTLAYQAATGLAAFKDSPLPAFKTRKLSEDELTKIQSMLPAVDLVLSGRGNLKTEVSESDNPDYAVKQTVSFPATDGAEKTLALYYNVTATENKNETEEEDGKTEEETEVKTKFEGIVAIAEQTFNFTGKTEIETETEGGMTEKESEMSLTISTGPQSYVEVKQEIETESGESEQEFKYKVVIADKLVSAYSLELEQDDGQKAAELKMNLDGVKYKFELIHEEEVTLIKVKVYQDESGETSFVKKIVTAEDGSTLVTYELLENPEK